MAQTAPTGDDAGTTDGQHDDLTGERVLALDRGGGGNVIDKRTGEVVETQREVRDADGRLTTGYVVDLDGVEGTALLLPNSVRPVESIDVGGAVIDEEAARLDALAERDEWVNCNRYGLPWKAENVALRTPEGEIVLTEPADGHTADESDTRVWTWYRDGYQIQHRSAPAAPAGRHFEVRVRVVE